MLYDLKEGTLEVGGLSIDYVSFGNGECDMVMIPGLTLKRLKGTGFTLAYMYRKFTKDFRIHIFDRRKNIPEGYTVRDIAEDVYLSMRELGIERACVVGVSQGGMAAQYLAIEHPEAVEKLVLGVTLSRSNDTVRGAVAEWTELLQKNELEELVMSTMRYNYPQERLNKYKLMMPALAKAGKPKDPQEFRRMADACLTCDVYDRLNEIKCPVLVMGDKQDKIASGKASEEIAEKLGCRLIMTDGFGHGVYEEKEFNEAMYDFLTEE